MPQLCSKLAAFFSFSPDCLTLDQFLLSTSLTGQTQWLDAKDLVHGGRLESLVPNESKLASTFGNCQHVPKCLQYTLYIYIYVYYVYIYIYIHVICYNHTSS